ncbi:hypothetical protein LZ318_12965 [Saccharopolyspora indica]|uniref:hypothetical protein n=1 Tax=Saccharopolyspora indica TaxID=1229659 RepID=UPI0022EB9471|nr:hypothetical protein [Saccharopolyspora indica]MDA3647194.1 hypothetical protein [Saccharopolyspora indica]
MANYTSVPFETQLALMERTAPLARLATSSAEMWRAAKAELTKSATSLQQNLRPLEEAWQDQAGRSCQARGRQSCADIDSWTQKIDGVVADLTGLAGKITETDAAFKELKAQLQAATAVQLVQLLLELQKAGGALLNALAADFQRATGTLAGAPGRPWSGPGGSSGGGASGTGGATGSPPAGGQSASASAGGGTGPSAASAASASGPGASASAGELPPDLAGDPTLQGMGTSTPPQTALPSLPPPAVAPTGQSVAPLVPPVGLLGGRTGGGVPGVRLGGGLRSIPQAAAPVSTEAAATSQKPPASPGQATPSHGAPRGGIGAVPPMSPMMGGIGAGGSTGRPGPGAAKPTATGRGAKPTSTPGLPASLRGRADRTDRAAFAPLSRPARREPVADDAVQLDEEMWQVDRAPAEIRGERPKPKWTTGR